MDSEALVHFFMVAAARRFFYVIFYVLWVLQWRFCFLLMRFLGSNDLPSSPSLFSITFTRCAFFAV